MVPAAMGRKAMVAVLCAIAVCPIAVLMSTQDARADAPVPLGQVPQSDAQPPDTADAVASADSSSSGQDQASSNDWLDSASASNWSWNDWFPGEGSATAPAASSEAPPWDATAPAGSWDSASSDATPTDSTSADAAPADSAPADSGSPDATAGVSLTADAPQADPALTAVTTLATDTLAAPALTAVGTTLSWTPTVLVGSYVFVRKVPGQADQYSIVSGTSLVPPAVPGQTVNYSVRTNVSGSSWAPEVSIAYPAAPTPPTTDVLAAPRLAVSGAAVTWTATATVNSYVFVRKVPGLADQYSLVSGTSIAPPAVPGQTVNYSVRTNVSGSSWAPEVSIAYPAAPTTPTPPPTTTPPPPSTPQPVDGTFQMGVVAGSALSYELPFVKQLGAHTARMEFSADTSASSMASTIDAYAKAGIRPMLLATFPAGMPTSAEAQNVGTWAAAYGPGGSFWAGKTYPANTAVTDIEFGNETSYSYQFSDNSLATYSSRAQTYALRAADAANAIRAANPNVGLLAQGDDAVNGTAWMTSMLKAVPNLADLAAGWTIHPYGPNWATRIDSTIDAAKAAGARDLPIFVTEWGLSTDNGRCLDDNYGFDTCMTYATAASTLHSALAGMESRYGSRLGAFFLYQAHDQYATGTQTGREAYFGALQSNGAAKGAYTTEVKADLAVN